MTGVFQGKRFHQGAKLENTQTSEQTNKKTQKPPNPRDMKVEMFLENEESVLVQKPPKAVDGKVVVH